MKILILGSQGFIGTHLVEYFLEKRETIFACDLIENTATGYNYKKLSVLSSDFDAFFANQNFDVCINASGSGNVAFSLENPLSDFEANTFSVAKVLDTIRKFQPTCKYIHISSAAVYGNPKELPVKEINEINPISPYGYHKWMSELICKEYYQLYNLPIAIVRPFSVYGNGLKKQLLWDICNKLNVEDTITLFGTGTESRDFLHISDLCKLLEKIISKSGFNSEIYNAATGIETTIRLMANIFEANFPGEKKILFSGESKPGDPINWLADISKIKQLGFEATFSLENGIRDYINWYFAFSK